MRDFANFKLWLVNNTNYSSETIHDIVSRIKRIDKEKEKYSGKIDVYDLLDKLNYNESVKCQIKKALKLYNKFLEYDREIIVPKGNMSVLSLFSNIGVAEAYLRDIGCEVLFANELIERRAILYSKIYTGTEMICGDIKNKTLKDNLIKKSIKAKIDVIMATPPCQGMSTAGQKLENDERNLLILDVIEIILKVKPRYIFLENVSDFYNTIIKFNGQNIKIKDYIKKTLSNYYNLNLYIIDTKDYSVPQSRTRAIVLASRKDMKYQWTMPKKEKKIVTLYDAIGDLPSLDPYVKDISKEKLYELFPQYEEKKEKALSISHWNAPPEHIYRQVIAMQHTPTGKSAFENKVYYPKKINGERVKGYLNTYKRQSWDMPAYTVTMDNRKISSQNNVHPGRFLGIDKEGLNIYSDARTLTLYEIMKVMSLPDDWNVPDDTSEAFLRRIIGEGIPPLFVKKVFKQLKDVYDYE